MAYKGKAVMSDGKDSSGKKKLNVKRKNRDVLQFFEDAADEIDGSDGSDWSDFFDDEDFIDFINEDPKVRSGPEKHDQPPLFSPKEEELSGDELEKMVEERYKTRSGFVRYAEDDYDNKRSVDRNFFMPSVVEPIIWKVKCKAGREKNVVFCLMQKYVDLKNLGTKLQIISTFAIEHIKGFVFVEAEKQSDVTEACYQLADVYCTLVAQVPSNELGQLMNVRKKNNEVKEGTWARVKNGIYRGDLTQVVAVNNERKRATVKLIPRVDMQALMEKYGGGSKLKRPKTVVPTARLISSRDLEELRPLMQYRRDRDTGKVFEFLDGLMLKDGFLFKKVSFESLAFWDVNPTEDELQKFALPIHDESDNVEWLSQLYGEKKKQCEVKIGKGGGKGEGSSGSNEPSGFEVHDLVLFGKRDFGMVIGMEKDEKYKVLKEGSEGPVTLTFEQKLLKYVPMEKKFTAADHRMKTISINDTVKILDGPIKGKQGIVKQVYRGVIFIYDENDLENAYFCSKSKMSEKIKNSDSACHGKDEGGPSTFDDIPSSPKSPLSKPWQMRENNSDDRSEKGAIFSVGQSLRIRVGPLKGYLCRVIAVRYSEVTVKLDSQQKVLTVKPEHLSEVRDKSSTLSVSDDPGLASSFKPFDLLGANDSSNDWLQGTTASADGDGGWNVGSSNERSTWGAVSSWGTSAQEGTTVTGVPDSVNNDPVKEDTWLTKVNSNQNSDTNTAWGKPAGAGTSNNWGKAKDTELTEVNRVEDAGGWNKIGSSGDTSSSGWGKQKASDLSANPEKSTGDPSAVPIEDSWGKATGGFKSSSVENKGWGSSSKSPVPDKGWGNDSGKAKIDSESAFTKSGNSSDTAWNKAPSGPSSWGQNSLVKDKTLAVESSSWGKSSEARDGVSAMDIDENKQDFGSGSGFGGRGGSRDFGGSGRGQGGSSWGNASGNEPSRNKSWDSGTGGSSWGKTQADEGQNKAAEGGSSWGKPKSGGSSWGNAQPDEGQNKAGGSSWGKSQSEEGMNKAPESQQGGSTWGNSSGGGSWGKSQTEGGDGGSSWGQPKSGGSSWGNAQTSGNSGGRGCFKCGEEGHMSRECPSGGGGGGGRGGGRGCFKCGEEGHMSRECPSGGGGGRGGGRGCFKCGEEGHMSRECPSGGGGGRGGGRGCFKCGEEGHMSRECPSGGGGGRGGGRGCFKCGEEGHMSRECPSGGGGGGRGCFKCGEEGHMSRECPSGGGGGRGGGRGCFKCGEEGHMSRECPSGDGGSSWGQPKSGGSSWGNSGGGSWTKSQPDEGGEGGSTWGQPKSGGSSWGNAQTSGNSGGRGSGCFKCGEEGHMSRECPSGGGGGRGGGRGCFKCGEEGHMSRECPSGGGGGGRGGGRGCFKCGEEGHMSRECPSGGGGGGWR